VIRQASFLGIEVKEGFFTKDDVENSSECFITNSIQELVPIRKLANKPLLGKEGPIYSSIHEAFIKEVEQG